MKNDHSIRLIVFDLDGTLIDAYRPVYRSVNYALKRFGFAPVDGETIKRTVGRGEKHLMRSFVGARNLEKVLPVYRRHHQKELKDGTKFLPGAFPLLKKLKKNGYRLAIATNRAGRSARAILRHLEAKQYFDYILSAEKVTRLKPHPEILNKVLQRFRVRPADAIYVGDMTIDVQTGNRAGVKTVAVTTGSSTRAEIARLKPFKIIRRVDELWAIVKRLDGQK